MQSYLFSFPAGSHSGLVTIRATDSNQTDDSKRSNQLWVDELAIINTQCDGGDLGAPSGLTASATGPNSISLSWSDNACLEDGYVIERATDALGPLLHDGKTEVDQEPIPRDPLNLFRFIIKLRHLTQILHRSIQAIIFLALLGLVGNPKAVHRVFGAFPLCFTWQNHCKRRTLA